MAPFATPFEFRRAPACGSIRFTPERQMIGGFVPIAFDRATLPFEVLGNQFTHCRIGDPVR